MWPGGIAKQVPRNALRALAETRAQQRKNSHQFRSSCRSFGYSRCHHWQCPSTAKLRPRVFKRRAPAPLAIAKAMCLVTSPNAIA
ncbi:hypothetical protein PC116_g12707 [Phytophthora cactorum]|nr:hypothetical protein PC128_g11526 [Phytophthora cactorum]KAG4048608.1 hypothetical protein PC123_g16083 [Phytophthora cactorum]KAG4239277.1 hypothetical protein PC116_g12707 [Phytophthora cactorum]